MAYPEQFLIPMRADLTQYGVDETRTPAEVDRVLDENGTVLMIVNSVCGCAAGRARPAVGMALQHSVRPDKVATVFAGGDDAAVAHLRQDLLQGVPPSSPSMFLFQNGKPVYMIHRHQIEPRTPEQIATMLVDAFDRFCVPAKQ